MANAAYDADANACPGSLGAAYLVQGFSMMMPVEPVQEMAAFSLDRLERETRAELWLTVKTGSDQAVRLPIFAARGRAPGRTLAVVAGVHGNEYEGMEAVRRVVAELDPATMHGNLLAIIVANPFAYAARARSTPSAIDGMNLARVFPGNAEGSPTLRLAAALFDLVMRHATTEDLVLDFHSGTAETTFLPMCGFRVIENSARDASEEAARHMGLPRLWAIPDSAGPLNAEIARRGIPVIGTETTGRAGCRGADVLAYESGLWNLLAYLRIVRHREVPPRDPQPAKTTINVTAPVAGFVRVTVHLGQHVHRDQQLATVVEVFGAVVAEVRSPVDGEVWAAVESPVVESGDLLFMIAFDCS